MLDFGGISKAADALETGIRTIDRRLEEIVSELRIANALAAMTISDAYAARTGHPADVQSVYAEAVGYAAANETDDSP